MESPPAAKWFSSVSLTWRRLTTPPRQARPRPPFASQAAASKAASDELQALGGPPASAVLPPRRAHSLRPAPIGTPSGCVALPLARRARGSGRMRVPVAGYMVNPYPQAGRRDMSRGLSTSTRAKPLMSMRALCVRLRMRHRSTRTHRRRQAASAHPSTPTLRLPRPPRRRRPMQTVDGPRSSVPCQRTTPATCPHASS